MAQFFKSRLCQLLNYSAIGVATIGTSILLVQSVPSLADITPLQAESPIPLVTPTPSPKPVSKPVVKPPVPKVPEFRVVGTEPFWSITIAQKGITYQTPEAKPVKYSYAAPRTAEGRTVDSTMVYRLGRAGDTLILKKVHNGFCSDGMSDKEYPYSATLLRGNQIFDGCAESLPKK